MGKIFFIEDDISMINFWKLVLKSEIIQGKLTVVTAMNLEEAERKFLENHDFAIIVIDGCVPGRQLNTLPLAKKIRKSFLGDMIAVSSIDEYRKLLLQAGCNLDCEKEKLPWLILKLINKDPGA